MDHLDKHRWYHHERETRIQELKSKILEMQKELDALQNFTLKPDESRAVLIPWPKFLQCVDDNKELFIKKGFYYPHEQRHFCKYPDCTNRRGKIDKYKTLDAFYLSTFSHGEWRICGDCVRWGYCRRYALDRPNRKESTRPPLTKDSMIKIDPFIYPLKLAEILVQSSASST